MMLTQFAPLILLMALMLDAVVGDPDWLWRRVPHPVVVMGRAIGLTERALNRSVWGFAMRRAAGIVAVLVLLTVAAGLGLLVSRWCAGSHSGLLVEVVIVASLLAQRSLHEHVARVRDAFAAGGLAAARQAVSMIVGRDPEALDEAGVSRAAIETLAENFSDGVVAPAFWYLVAGLPGILAYKLLNTADSMIGHRSERYRAFGWAAARLDDGANLVPARLSGLLLIAASWVQLGVAAARSALAAMLRDAGRHKSPNAGWPEAAMAGALGIALAGPRIYGGTRVDDDWMNDGGRQAAAPEDISRALALFRIACLGLWLAIVLLAARPVWHFVH